MFSCFVVILHAFRAQSPFGKQAGGCFQVFLLLEETEANERFHGRFVVFGIEDGGRYAHYANVFGHPFGEAEVLRLVRLAGQIGFRFCA